MTKKSPLAAALVHRNHHQPSLTVECASLSHPRNPRAGKVFRAPSLYLSLCAWSEVLYGLAQLEVCARWRVCKVVFVFSRFIAQISTRMSESCVAVFVVAAASDWRSDSHQYHRAVQTAERAAIVNTPAKANPASSSSVFSRGFVTPSAFLWTKLQSHNCPTGKIRWTLFKCIHLP